jgi:thiol-disulfide isomerase/thioredoxin
MSRAWPSARILWALVGAAALATSAIGAYFALRQAESSEAAPQSGFVLRAHPAPRRMPELAFADGRGTARTLAGFRGRVVLLNVWATWCAPCREEMPALDRLQQKLGGPGFEVVALSIDAGGAAAVKQFYDEIGIRALGIYVDPASRAMGAMGLVGIPTTLLIDRRGREIGRRTGPAQWDGAEAVRMIEGYLKGPKT